MVTSWHYKHYIPLQDDIGICHVLYLYSNFIGPQAEMILLNLLFT